MREPIQTQDALLRTLLEQARDTEWGKRFRFDKVLLSPDIISAYQEAVPLHTYEAFRADIDRIRRGERDIIWPGGFTDFAVSSGTASAGKIIPLSTGMLNANRRFSMDLMFNYVATTGKARVWGGKFLSLPGRIEDDLNYPGTLIGEVSGLQARYAPPIISKFYLAPGDDILNEKSWEKKLERIVNTTIDMDIRSLAMVPTWALVLFEKLIARKREQGFDATCVKDVWPNLTVFFSGGVALSSYRTLLEDQIGSGGIDFIESYGASEGFMSFQVDPAARDMVLHLDNGVFFEFVPMEELGSENPSRLTLADVQIGQRYAMIVSTCSGLWAYQIGDVIRFTSLDPFRIVVAGRTGEMIDKFGEAVFGDEARAAIQRACTETDARFLEFHIAPSEPDRQQLPRHQWIIEFERQPADIVQFATVIDQYLQEHNRHYFIRRDARAFDGPDIVLAPKGLFYKWLTAEKGSVSAQTKMPRMSEERGIADGLLALLN